MSKVLLFLGLILLALGILLFTGYFGSKKKMLNNAQATGYKIAKVEKNKDNWAKGYNIYLPKDKVSTENIISIAADLTFKEEKGIKMVTVDFFDNETFAKNTTTPIAHGNKEELIKKTNYLICSYDSIGWKLIAGNNYPYLKNVNIK